MNQAFLAFDAPLAETHVGFEIGWDFAHHGLAPPTVNGAIALPWRRGWEAGRAVFGVRTLPATSGVRRWLQLRVIAWQRGIAFEGLQVTPNYLRQIDVGCCPVTRQALTQGAGRPSDATVERVRDDAAYAAGNLAVLSARAHAAKTGRGLDDLLARMRLAESLEASAAERPAHIDGDGPDALRDLDAAQWTRLALLRSFVTALPHTQAASLPLRVLPPNRLRLLNPIQALQALATRQLGHAGWSTRIARIEALIPSPARPDFQRFVHALWPRVHESGRHSDTQATRWALEDAWRCPRVLRSWSRFASQLTPRQAELVVVGACALRMGTPWAQAFTLEQATQGWGVDGVGARAGLLDPLHANSRRSAAERHVRPQGGIRPVAAQVLLGA